MKCLSIRQPWAWLICAGLKDIENRTWRTSFRGRIYVHAGQTMDVNFPGRSLTEDWILVNLSPSARRAYHISRRHRGAIIGEVDIVDCICQSDSPWFEGPYGFVLRNPCLYPSPVPYKGRLGLFEVELRP